MFPDDFLPTRTILNLDLKDLTSAELFLGYGLTIITRIIVWILHEHSETWNFSPTLPLTLAKFQLFLQMREEILAKFQFFLHTREEIRVDFMEYSRYLQDSPSQGTQATLTQETKKV